MKGTCAMAILAMLGHGQDARGTSSGMAIPIKNIGTGPSHEASTPRPRVVKFSLLCNQP
jgi:hypothetical protein